MESDSRSIGVSLEGWAETKTRKNVARFFVVRATISPPRSNEIMFAAAQLVGTPRTRNDLA
ncbi:hypothetical protein WN51_04266 [Melipona quadrifasciata]|uniref:Uncharacterized protein n=1 Tax=Melipona quadrifasciata TaxID=166423 RepID=A0A0N0BCM7_9HYME|nr:hypothetical protein WN51_04266 [Melipona quadrifasciata]